MKVKIINIQPVSPPYEYLSPDERPEQYWERPDGSWLGFWPREWPDLLGIEILKETNKFGWEVWQPDLRADRIYSKTIENGVIHRLFPAMEKKYRLGFKTSRDIFSREMISQLRSTLNKPVILQLHGLRSIFLTEILEEIGPSKMRPISIITHGMVVAPLEELFGWHRPITYLNLLMEQRHYRRILRYVDIITVQNRPSRMSTSKIFKGRVEQLTMGCDFDFWRPVESLDRRDEIRKEIGVPSGAMLFFTASRFVPIKQLDKLIQVFHRVSHRDDFFLLIAGEGAPDYTAYLHKIISGLSMDSKVRLHPYATGNALRDLYWGADVYVSVSRTEGNPVSVMKAMACELPVLTTPVGGTAELMIAQKVGMFVPIYQYDKWIEAIIKILDDGPPAPIDIMAARNAYDWPNVARRFINIYDKLLSRK